MEAQAWTLLNMQSVPEWVSAIGRIFVAVENPTASIVGISWSLLMKL